MGGGWFLGSSPFDRTKSSPEPLVCTERVFDDRVAIAAIVKNEGPYLLEWIAFHRAIGIKQFFIADNISDDGSTELLIALAKAGIVKRMPFPTVPGQAPQLPAYEKLMQRYRGEADWVAFIDCDEFLTLADGVGSIHDFLAPIEADESVGAVYINWVMFGSSQQTSPTNELVIARFSMRAKDTNVCHKIVKTLVRSKAFHQPGLDPHYIVLRENFRAVHTDGSPFRPHHQFPGLSAAPVWERMRLNHYFVKSKAEFDFIKLPRGRADIADTRRDESEFQQYDSNDLCDPMPERLVATTKDEIERLRGLLRKIGCSEELVVMDRKLAERAESLRKKI